MNCSQHDWKAYALGELDSYFASEAAAHLTGCANCREEVAGLQATLTAMSSLREEELPRRIAFVSDKVFEPKWWQRVFSPTFASACVLAGAIVFHATYSSRGPTDAEVQARIDKAVAEEVEIRTVGYDQRFRMLEPILQSSMQLTRN